MYKCPYCGKEIDKLLFTGIQHISGSYFGNSFYDVNSSSEPSVEEPCYYCPECDACFEDEYVEEFEKIAESELQQRIRERK